MEKVRGINRSNTTKATYMASHIEHRITIVQSGEYVFVQEKMDDDVLYKLYLFRGDKIFVTGSCFYELNKEEMKKDLDFCIKLYAQDMEELEKKIENGLLNDDHNENMLETPLEE